MLVNCASLWDYHTLEAKNPTRTVTEEETLQANLIHKHRCKNHKLNIKRIKFHYQKEFLWQECFYIKNFMHLYQYVSKN